ncbi:YfiR family protein [Pokkaliibacter sp. MBI-7]|uniref:YfiR family protein n=1 Tax=Pokkaliibacter sp. MBI-7 TaxID=3040600 RepID=UPI00244B8DC4|nr:YfiR family protein [Pokkaliibacter sp. MBI-7]MDH2433135.1 YfiR family protein [Pokkaliibacter sp. MBI-7]
MKWLLPLCLLLTLPWLPAQASDLEQSIKAAFLYKFCDYVEWPAEVLPANDSPIVIGILSSNSDMAQRVQQAVEGHRIGNHPIQISLITEPRLPLPLHVLFLGPQDRLGAELQRQLQGQPVLVVTDGPEDDSPLSIINFRLENNRVRFDISLTAARASNLRISSRLLALAYQIRGATR